MRALRRVCTSIAVVAGVVSCGSRAQEVWLPYPDGLEARCAQGAFGTFSHGGIHAWDFVLPQGRPVVAAAPGRVIRVIDDRHRTGKNVFDDANQVFIDQGNGIFATYLHHVPGSARVEPGQLVATGTHLADVGASGTGGPHIHFDVRGPSWHVTHAVRFRVAGGSLVDARQGEFYKSATPSGEKVPADFTDSTVRGDEFAANRVKLERDPSVTIFRIRAESRVVFRGEVPAYADQVFFYLWQDSGPTQYSARAPSRRGKFELEVKVPASLKGQRWYRITTTDEKGNLLDVATLPVQVE